MRVFSTIWLVAIGLLVAGGCSGGGGSGDGDGSAEPLPAGRQSGSIAPAGAASSPDIAASKGCVYFTAGPPCHGLSATPSRGENTTAWAALEFASGRDAFGPMQISNAANRYLDNFDDAESLDELPIGAPSTKETVLCDDVPWSNYVCSLTGMNGKIASIHRRHGPRRRYRASLLVRRLRERGRVCLWDSTGRLCPERSAAHRRRRIP